MKKLETTMEEMRSEYDLKTLRVRKLGPGRKSFGGLVVRLEPDVVEAFPDAESVNEALRSLKSKATAPQDDLRQIDYFIDLCVCGAKEIRDRLKVDESFYCHVAPSAHTRGRDHYLYAVLDEVERTGIALMQLKEHVEEDIGTSPTSDQEGQRVQRNALTAIRDEQFLWIRKLTELLIDLINFSRTNTHEYFKHYLVCKALDDYRKLQSDFKDYHGCENANARSSIELFTSIVSSLETKVQRQKCWYLQFSKTGTSRKLSSFKARFDSALGLASIAERTVLGLSYESAYSRVSRGVHPDIGRPDNRASIENLKVGMGNIGMLVMHTLIRCRRLLGIRTAKGLVAQVAKISASNRHPTELYARIANPKISKGDLVIVYGDLGEVMRSVKSKFGYKSYLIRYLSRPPIQEIDMDWFPAKYLTLAFKGPELRKRVRERFRAVGASISAKAVAQSLRQTALELWDEGGLKEWARGDGIGAEQKGEALVEKHRKQLLEQDADSSRIGKG